MMETETVSLFLKMGERISLSIYSSLTPQSAVAFILHIMLVCGSFEMELDLIRTSSLCESLFVAKLIGIEIDKPSLQVYSIKLLLHVINDILPSQPVSMQRIDGYIVAAKNFLIVSCSGMIFQ